VKLLLALVTVAASALTVVGLASAPAATTANICVGVPALDVGPAHRQGFTKCVPGQ
jgi:hypothetical protein